MKVMIDPGHGGKDPGAVSAGLQEKDVTLRIAHLIRERLAREKGIRIRLTRETDTFVSLHKRAQLANEWHADYFLSIHINAGGGSGFESFIHPSSPKPTRSYQDTLHAHVVSQLGRNDRGKKRANFAVLRETTMPALLTENLFIDHTGDRDQLRKESVLEAMATGHADGLKHLYDKASPSTNQKTYRVIVNGVQTGAYRETANILHQVERHLGSATSIHITER
ncbi:N-acetylmuramoyl-L-alanine amidase family protein [Alteribacillus iranensis]|uniref:N-acetylmuramoyl-L-alanine amidase n=1 Tax=Alteribacillus iranensis TaxID=930128 RepID=A0A1I2BTB7_9BACI|nr:N-acetylmuramoyl-L-alanine amidase [Alteribacillus iranensis]SFE59371.1 N-acetylmuramoyl-L-alanine amidase [Alteribacillus iranensis]